MSPASDTARDLLESYSITSSRERRAREQCGDPAATAARLVADAQELARAGRAQAALDTLERAERSELDLEALLLRARCALRCADARAEACWRDVERAARAIDDTDAASRAVVALVIAGAVPSSALVEDTDPATPWGMHALAMSRYHDGAWRDAIEQADAPLAAARELGSTELEAGVLRLVANAHAMLGELELSAAVLGELLECSDPTTDPVSTIIATMCLVETLLEELRTTDAAEVAARLERTMTDPQTAAWAMAVGASVSLATGRQNDAARRMRASLERSPLEGSSAASAYRAMILAECVLATAPDTSASVRIVDDAEHVLQRFGFRSYLERLRVVRGIARLEQGDAAPSLRVLATIDAENEPVDTALAALQLARAWRSDARVVGADIAWSLGRVGRTSPASRQVELSWREVDALLAGDVDAVAAIAAEWMAAGRLQDAARARLAAASMASAGPASDHGHAYALALSALRGLLDCGDERGATLARMLLRELDAGCGGAFAALVTGRALSALDEVLLVRLAQVARPITVPAGALLDDALADEDGLVVLASGTAFTAAGAERAAPILDVHQAGDAIVLDWQAHARAHEGRATGAVRASLLAASEVTAYVVDAGMLRELAPREPRLLATLLTLSERATQRARALATELATADTRERLARLLLWLADRHGRDTLRGEMLVDVPLTAAQLARMCGTQRQRVSTELAAWRRAGVLDTWRRCIVVLDGAALESAAGIRTLDASA